MEVSVTEPVLHSQPSHALFFVLCFLSKQAFFCTAFSRNSFDMWPTPLQRPVVKIPVFRPSLRDSDALKSTRSNFCVRCPCGLKISALCLIKLWHFSSKLWFWTLAAASVTDMSPTHVLFSLLFATPQYIIYEICLYVQPTTPILSPKIMILQQTKRKHASVSCFAQCKNVPIQVEVLVPRERCDPVAKKQCTQVQKQVPR